MTSPQVVWASVRTEGLLLDQTYRGLTGSALNLIRHHDLVLSKCGRLKVLLIAPAKPIPYSAAVTPSFCSFGSRGPGGGIVIASCNFFEPLIVAQNIRLTRWSAKSWICGRNACGLPEGYGSLVSSTGISGRLIKICSSSSVIPKIGDAALAGLLYSGKQRNGSRKGGRMISGKVGSGGAYLGMSRFGARTGFGKPFLRPIVSSGLGA